MLKSIACLSLLALPVAALAKTDCKMALRDVEASVVHNDSEASARLGDFTRFDASCSQRIAETIRQHSDDTDFHHAWFSGMHYLRSGDKGAAIHQFRLSSSGLDDVISTGVLKGDLQESLIALDHLNDFLTAYAKNDFPAALSARTALSKIKEPAIVSEVFDDIAKENPSMAFEISTRGFLYQGVVDPIMLCFEEPYDVILSSPRCSGGGLRND